MDDDVDNMDPVTEMEEVIPKHILLLFSIEGGQAATTASLKVHGNSYQQGQGQGQWQRWTGCLLPSLRPPMSLSLLGWPRFPLSHFPTVPAQLAPPFGWCVHRLQCPMFTCSTLQEQLQEQETFFFFPSKVHSLESCVQSPREGFFD